MHAAELMTPTHVAKATQKIDPVLFTLTLAPTPYIHPRPVPKAKQKMTFLFLVELAAEVSNEEFQNQPDASSPVAPTPSGEESGESLAPGSAGAKKRRGKMKASTYDFLAGGDKEAFEETYRVTRQPWALLWMWAHQKHPWLNPTPTPRQSSHQETHSHSSINAFVAGSDKKTLEELNRTTVGVDDMMSHKQVCALPAPHPEPTPCDDGRSRR